MSLTSGMKKMKSLKSSLAISHNRYVISRKSNEFLVHKTRSSVAMSLEPSPKTVTSNSEAGDGDGDGDGMGIKSLTISYAPMAFCIGFLFLFVFFMNKKAVKSAKEKEKEILKSHGHGGSPLISTPSRTNKKTVEEEEEACSELVFFVGEHERFRLQDLLESAADLQSQSLCSSLYKVTLNNDAVYAVKRLRMLQGTFEEFGQTMRRIGNLRHPNILPLVCYSSSKEEKLLIYKYQRNGSLLALLQGKFIS